MTLLINEIHVQGDLRKSLILLAADRRLTLNGKFHSNRKKLFEIPYLNAGMGYFGLAQANQKEFFSSWLPNFIRHAAQVNSLEEFAQRLCTRLNGEVSKALLAKNPSGFHICGFNCHGFPELQFVRNIRQMEAHRYKDFMTEYFVTEDFLRRDAREMGFDGTNPTIPNHFIQYYINGDIRPFHSIWKRLDDFLKEMLFQEDFKQPGQDDDLVQIAKWKMQVIASFYKKFAKKQTIGTPIDAFILIPQANTNPKGELTFATPPTPAEQ